MKMGTIAGSTTELDLALNSFLNDDKNWAAKSTFAGFSSTTTTCGVGYLTFCFDAPKLRLLLLVVGVVRVDDPPSKSPKSSSSIYPPVCDVSKGLNLSAMGGFGKAMFSNLGRHT